MSVKESNFQEKLKWTLFQVYFKGFHLSYKTVMLRNSFSVKHLPMTTGNFWTYCGQSLAGLCLFTEVNIQDNKEKCSENFSEYFSTAKQNEQMWKHPQIFSTILTL